MICRAIQSRWTLQTAWLLCALPTILGAQHVERVAASNGPDFDREVRPILVRRCYPCHGPDAGQRRAGLRLDQRAGATRLLDSGHRAIVPGDAEASELLRRVTSTDRDERMPPDAAPLSHREIGVLVNWVRAGAAWPEHWSFRPIARPRPPAARDAWLRNAIDRFVLAALLKRGWRPSQSATRSELIRRLSFDLRGVPPAPAEVVAFENSRHPAAYEQLVERYLASPQFGEHAARLWLDLARYADTHGFHIDSHRDMWRWRDWVIDALNRNYPFDRFTIDQLAGDLLPNATLEQLIATGFNRNHMINFEGGALADEYRNEYVVDRTVTVATVWLGQTLRCCRCHDHKYDPFTQRDFYRLYAFFNNVSDKGLDGEKGNARPYISAPTYLQQLQLVQLARDVQRHESSLRSRVTQSQGDFRQWLSRLSQGAESLAGPPTDFAAYYSLNETQRPAAQLQIVDGSSAKRHAPWHGDEPYWVDGKFDDALLFDGQSHATLPPLPDAERPEAEYSFAFWLSVSTADPMIVVSRAPTSPSTTTAPRPPEIKLSIVDYRLRLEIGDDRPLQSDTQLTSRQWSHIGIVVSHESSSARLFVDGKPVTWKSVDAAPQAESEVDEEEGPVDGRWRIGGMGSQGGLRGLLDELKVFGRSLSTVEFARLSQSHPIRDILSVPQPQRSKTQTATLHDYYLNHVDDAYVRELNALRATRRQQRALQTRVPTTMVMDETSPRNAHILVGGDYRRQGDRVTPGTPGILPAWKATQQATRLELAQWLVDRDNPLVARVTVNRVWAELLGRGIVATTDDFGTRGSRPTHPQLLDWLAIEFIESGWDVKQLYRCIVNSATYRQSSRDVGDQRDPDNRWLARAARRRLSAEMIRDNALELAGLLHRRIGGPSVYPYQPPGLWQQVSFNPRDFTAQVYKPSRGAQLYRRGIYTFWKRTVPPTGLAVFNAPNRETCSSTRRSTRTAQQALALMNDPTYVEAARHFAHRVLSRGGPTTTNRLNYAFRVALARPPTDAEQHLLSEMLQDDWEHFQAYPDRAAALLQVGDTPCAPGWHPPTLAAWTNMMRLIMNLEETIHRP